MRSMSALALAVAVLVAAAIAMPSGGEEGTAAAATPAGSADPFDPLRDQAFDLLRKHFPPRSPTIPVVPRGLPVPPGVPGLPGVPVPAPDLRNGGYLCPVAGPCPDHDPCARLLRDHSTPPPVQLPRPGARGGPCHGLPRHGDRTIRLP